VICYTITYTSFGRDTRLHRYLSSSAFPSPSTCLITLLFHAQSFQSLTLFVDGAGRVEERLSHFTYCPLPSSPPPPVIGGGGPLSFSLSNTYSRSSLYHFVAASSSPFSILRISAPCNSVLAFKTFLSNSPKKNQFALTPPAH